MNKVVAFGLDTISRFLRANGAFSFQRLEKVTLLILQCGGAFCSMVKSSHV